MAANIDTCGSLINSTTATCDVTLSRGSALEVKIGDTESVSALKLYLATKAGEWLADNDSAALELTEGKAFQDIQTAIDGVQMKATRLI
ncbi:hypothetical protein PPTG_24886 [Phytophthora nicotianae INRA-310]|uniref:Uncharacterized protein n=2 Tax=Phytophthora nicotianae TaxID=4792 RepID=W2PC89_PHYN3|nr:hypothetical protein PPTG_24886 [Phytophthora nicotianae INRA-310]ETM97624.1 hypothetical protein PPTG_24886 [Phytophthora nicotianae INRA-310]